MTKQLGWLWVVTASLAGADSVMCQDRKLVNCQEIVFTLTRGWSPSPDEKFADKFTEKFLIAGGISRTSPTIIGWPPFNGFVFVDRRATDADDALEASRLGPWGRFHVPSFPTSGDAVRKAMGLLQQDVVAVAIISEKPYTDIASNRGYAPLRRRTVGVFSWRKRKAPEAVELRSGVPVSVRSLGEELIVTCDQRVFSVVLPRDATGARALRPVAGSVSLLVDALELPTEWQVDEVARVREWADIIGDDRESWLWRWSSVARDLIKEHYGAQLTQAEVCAFFAAMSRVEVRAGGDELRLPSGLEIVRRSEGRCEIPRPGAGAATVAAGELIALENVAGEEADAGRPALRWIVVNARPWIVVVDTWEERVVQWRD